MAGKLKESLPAEMDTNAMQAVQVLDKEIDRLDAVVKRFLDFTRPMEVRLEATQLADILREVVEVAQQQLQKAHVQVAQLLPIDVPEVYVDRALLKQAVLNLVLNAVEAMPSGGKLHVGLSRRGEMAEITVGDTGKGIPPENKQKIFQLFFYHAAGREWNWTREHVPNCAASQRFDRLYVGGRPRNYVPDRVTPRGLIIDDAEIDPVPCRLALRCPALRRPWFRLGRRSSGGCAAEKKTKAQAFPVGHGEIGATRAAEYRHALA